MKFAIIFLSVFFALICHSCLPLKSKEKIPYMYSRQIRSDVMLTLHNRHNVIVMGHNGGTRDGKYVMAITLKIKHPITLEAARYLIVDCAEELIATMNADECIRQYLNNQVFTYKNVEIFLYSLNSDGTSAHDPYINAVSVNHNEVLYCTSVPNGFGYLHEYVEKYEDAKETVLKEYGGVGKPYSPSACKP